jgi:DNA-directed RNA polymerase subunit RPC12/RpoP
MNSIINFMDGMDEILSGKNKKRCPYCGSEDIKIDTFMEKYNEDLGYTYYRCKRCNKNFKL